MRRSGFAFVGLAVLALGVWLVGHDAQRAAERRAEPSATRLDAPEHSELTAPRAQLAPSASAPPATAAREELAADGTASAAERGASARIVGRLVPAAGLVFDEQHPLGQTMLIWSVLPRADGAEAPELEIQRLLDFPDDDGRFELADAPVGHELELALTPALGPRQSLRVPALAPRERRVLAIVLEAGATISGVARDARGEPLAGAQVTLDDLTRSDLATLERDEMNRIRRTRTDATGAFRFAELPRGPWVLRLDGVPRPPLPLELDTRRGDLADLVLTQGSGPELRIVVVFPDGLPAAANLSVQPEAEFLSILGPGQFLLAGFERFPLRITARAWREGVLHEASAALTASDAELRLVLAPVEGAQPLAFAGAPRGEELLSWSSLELFEKRGECELVGRVEDVHGRAQSGARVHLTESRSSATTDARGEFFLDDLEEGLSLLIVEDARSGALLRRAVELTPRRRVCVELRLPVTNPILVRGRLEFGSVAPLAPIHLESELGFVQLTPAPDGTFEAEFPCAGRYFGTLHFGPGRPARRLEIEAPARAGFTLVVEDLPLAEGR